MYIYMHIFIWQCRLCICKTDLYKTRFTRNHADNWAGGQTGRRTDGRAEGQAGGWMDRRSDRRAGGGTDCLWFGFLLRQACDGLIRLSPPHLQHVQKLPLSATAFHQRGVSVRNEVCHPPICDFLLVNKNKQCIYICMCVYHSLFITCVYIRKLPCSAVHPREIDKAAA